MYVINELTGRKIGRPLSIRILVKHTPNCIIFGYVPKSNRDLIKILVKDHGSLTPYLTIYELVKDNIIFSNYHGYYISKTNLSKEEIIKYKYTMGHGDFPYSFFREYEAVKNFKLFDGKQVILNHEKNSVFEHMKYSFGLEFETSQGYIPENICFRDGLIPLKDGSITGLEYSTVVMNGMDGLSLLKQQLNTLRKYTTYNKECSLHIHLGGFPLDPDKIYNLYKLCRNLEPQLIYLLPKSAFNTENFKDNGKSYCKKLPSASSFNSLYSFLTGRVFYGSLIQPHPNDIGRQAKWRIQTRYYWANFINLICYDVNKTMEFRFLSPTFNFNKIIIWLMIFNSILAFAESMTTFDSSIRLEDIFDYLYPTEVADILSEGCLRLSILVKNQNTNHDFIGRDTNLENDLFRDIFKKVKK